MTYMRFPRVKILNDKQTIEEYGYLNKDMPQSDGSYMYEIYGDSGKVYILSQNEFTYISMDEPQ